MNEYQRAITDFLFLCDVPKESDIAFIPGNTHAEPSEKAAELYQSGIAPLFLPSGHFSIGNSGFAGQSTGRRTYPGSYRTEWEFMRAVLVENGVPAERILKEDEATYTWQNAIFSRRVTDRAGIRVRRALLCCMPVHARRAKAYYELEYPDAEILVCPADGAAVTRDNWYLSEEGIDTVLGELKRCGGQFGQIFRRLAGL